MSTDLSAAPLASRRSPLRRVLSPRGIHYLALAVAAIGYSVVSTRGWFFFDDFAFIVPSQQANIWMPHVGHWSTVPFSLFLVLRDLFGINSYLPFAIPVIVAGLAFAHVMWRFMLRVGVAPALATAFSLLLIFFGAGAENILWAFQVGFVGAMVFGMLVILILLRSRLRARDIVLVILLSIVALATSGTSLPLLAVAALIGWQRHGFRRTAALFAVPALVYATWFVLEGRFAPPAGRASVGQLISAVPEYALSMLSDGFGRAFPIAVLGSLLFAATGIWAVLSYRGASWRQRPAYLLFLAAPLFALFTAYSRVNLGLVTATSSRYLYFAISMVLPLFALGLTRLTRRYSLQMGAVVALVGLLVVYNLGGLVSSIHERQLRSDAARERFSAALALADEYPGVSASVRPAAQWAPDATLGDIEEFARSGEFRAGPYDLGATLTVRARFGLRVGSESAPMSESGCATFTPGAPAPLDGDEASVLAPQDGTVTVSLAKGGVIGDPVPLQVSTGWNDIRLSGPDVSGSGLMIASSTSSLTVCPPG